MTNFKLTRRHDTLQISFLHVCKLHEAADSPTKFAKLSSTPSPPFWTFCRGRAGSVAARGGKHPVPGSGWNTSSGQVQETRLTIPRLMVLEWRPWRHHIGLASLLSDEKPPFSNITC